MNMSTEAGDASPTPTSTIDRHINRLESFDTRLDGIVGTVSGFLNRAADCVPPEQDASDAAVAHAGKLGKIGEVTTSIDIRIDRLTVLANLLDQIA